MTAMDPAIHYTLRAAVSLLFLSALWEKAHDVRAFERTLADYHVVPAAFVPLAAVLVVAAEGAVIFLDGVAGVLLLVYAAAIAVNLARGRERIDCGCVGIAGRNGLSWWLVGRNLVCATMAFAVLVPPGSRTMAWIDHLSIVAGTAVLASLYLAADGLIANTTAFRRLREVA
jgi:hypothetical protein